MGNCHITSMDVDLVECYLHVSTGAFVTIKFTLNLAIFVVSVEQCQL